MNFIHYFHAMFWFCSSSGLKKILMICSLLCSGPKIIFVFFLNMCFVFFLNMCFVFFHPCVVRPQNNHRDSDSDNSDYSSWNEDRLLEIEEEIIDEIL